MTNKEFYQSVFSQVHPAAPVTWEGCHARSRRARRPRRLLMAAAGAAVLLITLMRGEDGEMARWSPWMLGGGAASLVAAVQIGRASCRERV